ncbi:MAG: riboflavin synthase, partial [Schleiferiaceae bacterium]|nr:riboflavin synthase [Schleiferiaceae bacterium]
MFTGIIENVGQIAKLEREGGNLHITVESALAAELKIDQSVAHDGCCLTVVELFGGTTPHAYRVTAIAETLAKTTVGNWILGQAVNIERCTVSGARLDGHVVQGHVDGMGVVSAIEDQDGSWKVQINHPRSDDHVTV